MLLEDTLVLRNAAVSLPIVALRPCGQENGAPELDRPGAYYISGLTRQVLPDQHTAGDDVIAPPPVLYDVLRKQRPLPQKVSSSCPRRDLIMSVIAKVNIGAGAALR